LENITDDIGDFVKDEKKKVVEKASVCDLFKMYI